MSSSGDDRFAALLQDPVFSFFVEIPADCGRGELLRALGENNRVFGTVVRGPAASLINCCQESLALTAKSVMAVLSGAGYSDEQMLELAEKLRNQGIRDFLAVTGALSLEHQEEAAHVGTALRSVRFPYLESTRMIPLLKQAGEDNVVGACVNPFQYQAEMTMLQYAKMMRKHHAGANFLVTQIGWDPMKLQELVWFLRSRELLIPLFARIDVNHERDGRKMSASQYPGVSVPLWLAASVSREAGQGDFMRLQLERAAFYAVGCKHLGYNGVVIHDLQTPEELTGFFEAYESLLAAMPTYEAWTQAAATRFQDVSFHPFDPVFEKQKPFYLFQHLLEGDCRDYDPYGSRPVPPQIDAPSMADRLEAMLTREGTPDFLKKMVKGRFPSVMRSAEERCLGLGNDACPKGLLHGVCGGIRPNGQCECGGGECFFLRVLRLAHSQKRLAELEGR